MQISARPYDWPHDASCTLQNTALVIIDMQRDFLEEGGYLSSQGYDVQPLRHIVPGVKELLTDCRKAGLPIFHTREGHRSDLSDLSSRELFRSRNNARGIGIGDRGPLGRALVRGEPGHDTISELYPIEGEPIIDKPGKGAFTHTDFDLLLRVQGVRNLILCGVTTDVCVHTTMREANDRGYDCVLVEDLCAASSQDLHNAAVEMVRSEGGVFGATTMGREIRQLMYSLALRP